MGAPYNPFVDQTAYRKTLYRPPEKPGDPPDEEIGWVELRALNAGDRAEFNEIRLQAEGAGVDVGLIQLMMVSRAIVAWSFEKDPTVDVIRQLDPRMFDQIFEHVSLGSPTLADVVDEMREPDPTDAAPSPSPGGGGGGNS